MGTGVGVVGGVTGGAGLAARTATVTGTLLTPLHTAVTVLAPPATPVTTPELLTVATAGVALVQLAGAHDFVEASEYVAVAESCCVPPLARLTDTGDSSTCTIVGVLGAGDAAPLMENGMPALLTPPRLAVTDPYPVLTGRMRLPLETDNNALLGVNVAAGPQSVVRPSA